MKSRIVIVGFMGCGKTTVARALAQLLNCETIDLDSVISEQEDRTISELIKERGESAFRGAETFALRTVLERKTARVIALGGGAWALERNRDLINAHQCVTIFLDAPFELCWMRIAEGDAMRPLALDRSAAHQLYRERYPLYALANLNISVTKEKHAEEIASDIVDAMRRRRFLKT